MVLSAVEGNGATTVMVLPIIHTLPEPGDTGIEIPSVTRKRLGLDHAPCWIMTGELNRFIWPGPDLRPVPGASDRFAYGLLPPRFFKMVRDSLVQRARRRQVKATSPAS